MKRELQIVAVEAKARLRNFVVSTFICLPVSLGCFLLGALSIMGLSKLLGAVGATIGLGIFIWLALYGLSAMIIPVMFLTIGADYTLIWIRMASLPFMKWLVLAGDDKVY